MKRASSRIVRSLSVGLLCAAFTAAIFLFLVPVKYGYSGSILSGYVVEYSDKEKGYRRPYLATEETAGIIQRTGPFLSMTGLVGPMIRPIPETHIVHLMTTGDTPRKAEEQFQATVSILQDIYAKKVAVFSKVSGGHAALLRDQIVQLKAEKKSGERSTSFATILDEKINLYAELQSVANHRFDIPYSVLHSESLGKIFPSFSLIVQACMAFGFLSGALAFLFLKKLETTSDL